MNKPIQKLPNYQSDKILPVSQNQNRTNQNGQGHPFNPHPNYSHNYI